jgi:hypothetical protein
MGPRSITGHTSRAVALYPYKLLHGFKNGSSCSTIPLSLYASKMLYVTPVEIVLQAESPATIIDAASLGRGLAVEAPHPVLRHQVPEYSDHCP